MQRGSVSPADREKYRPARSPLDLENDAKRRKDDKLAHVSYTANAYLAKNDDGVDSEQNGAASFNSDATGTSTMDLTPAVCRVNVFRRNGIESSVNESIQITV